MHVPLQLNTSLSSIIAVEGPVLLLASVKPGCDQGEIDSRWRDAIERCSIAMVWVDSPGPD